MCDVHFDMLINNVPRKSISRETIQLLINDDATKRINFAYTHNNALKRDTKNNVIGWLNLPFAQPFECMRVANWVLAGCYIPKKMGSIIVVLMMRNLLQCLKNL